MVNGIAETVDGYSRLLCNNLVVGETYRLQDIAVLLGIHTTAMLGKGVVNRGNAQLLFMHLEKDKFSTPQYEDHLEGSVLFWSGQNRVKSVEKALQNNSRDTFIFIQQARKTPFKYYGRAYPMRMQINWEPDIPSHIVFELYEYASQNMQQAILKTGFEKTLDVVASPNVLYAAEQPFSVETDALVKVRLSQSSYRRKALELWNNKCAVTNVDNPRWLIASHIKPWHESDNQEKIDPFNSLILTPNYDKLFDRGVISFSPKDGSIILPETQSREMWNNLCRMHIDETVKLSAVPDNTVKYLEYHNSYVYNFEPKDEITNDEFVTNLFAKACC